MWGWSENVKLAPSSFFISSLLLLGSDSPCEEPCTHAHGHLSMQGQILSKPSFPVLPHGHPSGPGLYPYVAKSAMIRMDLGKKPQRPWKPLERELWGSGCLEQVKRGKPGLRMGMFLWLNGLLTLSGRGTSRGPLKVCGAQGRGSDSVGLRVILLPPLSYSDLDQLGFPLSPSHVSMLLKHRTFERRHNTS